MEALSFKVSPGQHLLIGGTSGVGKSSLTRAIAGLWSVGSGTLYRPRRQDILFLPQQPYLVLGSLRQQLLYPHADPATDTATLRQVLQQVQLPELADSDLDIIDDWAQRLSMGEQQRLAFARLLLQQPPYAVLDEATSALAVAQEQQLYTHLSQTNITYISVGHRASLVPYHRQQLILYPRPAVDAGAGSPTPGEPMTSAWRRVIWPYWSSRERWGAWGLLLILGAAAAGSHRAAGGVCDSGG